MVQINPVLNTNQSNTISTERRISSDHGERVIAPRTLSEQETKENSKSVANTKIVAEAKETQEAPRKESESPPKQPKTEHDFLRGTYIDMLV